jgi:hypothetical protein
MNWKQAALILVCLWIGAGTIYALVLERHLKKIREITERMDKAISEITKNN